MRLRIVCNCDGVAHGITPGRVCFVGLITYIPSGWFHTALTGWGHTACGGFHTRLRRDWDAQDAKGERYGKKSFTWIFRRACHKMWTANLSAAIPTRFSNFANPRQVCLPILPKRNILKALPICSLNSRLQEKSVQKQKAGSNCFIIQRWLTKRPSKNIATSVAEYRECLLHLVSRLKRKLITKNL